MSQQTTVTAVKQWNGEFARTATSDLFNCMKETDKVKFVMEKAKIVFPISPKGLLNAVDQNNGRRLLREFRKLLPGILPSELACQDSKQKIFADFCAVLLPKRIPTGWKVDQIV